MIHNFAIMNQIMITVPPPSAGGVRLHIEVRSPLGRAAGAPALCHARAREEEEAGGDPQPADTAGEGRGRVGAHWWVFSFCFFFLTFLKFLTFYLKFLTICDQRSNQVAAFFLVIVIPVVTTDENCNISLAFQPNTSTVAPQHAELVTIYSCKAERRTFGNGPVNFYYFI